MTFIIEKERKNEKERVGGKEMGGAWEREEPPKKSGVIRKAIAFTDETERKERKREREGKKEGAPFSLNIRNNFSFSHWSAIFLFLHLCCTYSWWGKRKEEGGFFRSMTDHS